MLLYPICSSECMRFNVLWLRKNRLHAIRIRCNKYSVLWDLLYSIFDREMGPYSHRNCIDVRVRKHVRHNSIRCGLHSLSSKERDNSIPPLIIQIRPSAHRFSQIQISSEIGSLLFSQSARYHSYWLIFLRFLRLFSAKSS